MKPGKIDGATRTLGAPVNWNTERDGECMPLEIRDSASDNPGGDFMESAWYPSDQEKAAIAAGCPVILTLWGMRHPPVAVSVAAAPPDATELAPGELPPAGCVEVTSLTDKRRLYFDPTTGRRYVGDVVPL